LPDVAAHPDKSAAPGIGVVIHGLEKVLVAVDTQFQAMHGHQFHGHRQRLDRCHDPGGQRVTEAVEFGQFGADVDVAGDALLHPQGHGAAKAVNHDHQGGEQGHRRDQRAHGNGRLDPALFEIAGGQKGRLAAQAQQPRGHQPAELLQHQGGQ
jgi:hypothetical protein